MAPMAFFIYGGLIAMQALWAGPWLTHVAGYDAADAARGLFAINTTMLFTFLTWGLVMPRLALRGLDADRLMRWGLPLPLLVLAVCIGLGSRAGAAHWALWCAACSVVTLSQPALARAFPTALAGRALSAFNLVIFLGVFGIQWGTGVILDALRAFGWNDVQSFRGAFTGFALLSLTALICIVLGMGMPTTAVYLLVAVLAAPPLIQLGVLPIAAHMFVFYFGIVSLITPPVAMAAYVAANLARASTMETAIMSVRLGWTSLVVPVMFVMSPDLIMQGSPFNAGVAFITGVAGVWLATVGLVGYFLRPLRWLMRLNFLVAGIALLIPARAFPGADTLELAGIAFAAALVGGEFWIRKRQRAAARIPV